MELPAELVEHIVRLTNPTPRDACRMACLSSTFRLVVDSDTVWRRFLPPDYKSLMERADDSSSISHASLKELYFLLCEGNLLMNRGTLSFWLDRRSGKKCHMTSAQTFYIWCDGCPWGKEQFFVPGSRSTLLLLADHTQLLPLTPYRQVLLLGTDRLPLAMELVDVDCLELSKDLLDLELLTRDTRYSMYLVFKSEVGDEAGVIGGKYRSCLNLFPYDIFIKMSREGRALYFGDPLETVRREEEWETAMPRKERKDGWMELELAELYIGQDEDKGEGSKIGQVSFSLRENKVKFRLTIQGIEIRPKED